MRKDTDPGPKKRRRLLAAGAGALAVATMGVAAAVLPGAGLRWGMVEALRKLGMVEVTFTEADLSLYNGAIVVRRMAARPQLGKALGLGDLALNFRWRPLLDKRVSVEALALSGLDIAIERTNDGGYVVNGLPLAVGPDPSPDKEPWTFEVDSLKLGDSRLTFTDGDLAVEVAVDSLAIENLHSQRKDQVARLSLKGRIDGAPVVIDGTATPFADRPGFRLHLGLDGLDVARFAALAKAVKPQGKATAQLDFDGVLDQAGPSVSVDGQLALHGLHAEPGEFKLSGASLQWDGHAALGQQLALHGKLDGKGLTLAAPGTDVAVAGLAVELARLQLDGRLAASGSLAATGIAVKSEAATAAADAVNVKVDELDFDRAAQALTWKGGAKVDKAAVSTAGVDVRPRLLDWSGATRLDLSKAQPTGRLEGRLAGEELSLRKGDLVADQKAFAAEGSVDLPLAARLAVKLDGTSVREPRLTQDWLKLDRAEAATLALAPDGRVELTELSVSGLSALQRKAGGDFTFPWRLELAGGKVDRLAVEPSGAVTAGSASLNGATVRLTRTGVGFLGVPAPKDGAAANAKGKDDADLPRISLGRLAVAKGKVQFEDRTPSEWVRMQLESIALSVSNLDSAAPERDSPFSLSAEVGEASINAGGSVRPFAEKLSGDIKGEVKALELPPLSPYAADTLGLHLNTGHFDGKLGVAIKKGDLAGKVDLTLSNLFVAQPDPGSPIAKKAQMPVETVLDLLRDGEDRIRLAIPISGRLDNPDFDISDAVSQAVGGALRNTAATTLKVLFPVAALVSLVVDEDEKPRLSLQSLAFAPGGEAVSGGDAKGLAPVADLLKQRPGLKLSLCPVAVSAKDWPAILEARRQEKYGLLAGLQKFIRDTAKTEAEPPDHDALSELARHRGAAAKQFLVDELGIDPGRVFECRPKVEMEGAGEPRVELLL